MNGLLMGFRFFLRCFWEEITGGKIFGLDEGYLRIFLTGFGGVWSPSLMQCYSNKKGLT